MRDMLFLQRPGFHPCLSVCPPEGLLCVSFFMLKKRNNIGIMAGIGWMKRAVSEESSSAAQTTGGFMKKVSGLAVVFLLLSMSVFGANEGAFLKRGMQLFQAKKYSEAAPYFKRAAQINPKNPAAHIYLGYCYMALGNRSAAVASLEAGLKLRENAGARRYLNSLKAGGRAASGPAEEPYYYDGGWLRTEALAGPRLVLRDPTSAFDLYGIYDISAGLILRPKKNYISAGLFYYGTWMVTESEILTIKTSSNQFAGVYGLTGLTNNKMTVFNYYLSGKDAIAVRFGAMPVSTRNEMQISGLKTFVNGDMIAIVGGAEYSRRLTDILAAGVSLGYRGTHLLGYEYDEFGSFFMSESSKIEWAVSGCFSPGLGSNQGRLDLGVVVSNNEQIKLNNYVLLDFTGNEMQLASHKTTNINVWGGRHIRSCQKNRYFWH